MNSVVANVVGMIGSALMVIAYGYSNVAKQVDFRLFNTLNLIGALMLIASLTVHFNMAAMAMEIIWAFIALFGLMAALRKRA